MSQVTIELNQILKIQNFELFDFDYPYLNEIWKQSFEEQFKDHYYFYEIGVETPDRFRQRLKSRLNLELPDILLPLANLDLVKDPLLLEKTIKTYSEGQDNAKVESGSTKQDSENKNTLNTQTNTINDMTVSDYPQHANIENDIPTKREQNTLTGTNIGDETGSTKVTETLSKNTNDTREKQGQEEVQKIGGLKEYQAYLNLQRNTIKQAIEVCKTLFILVY